MVNRTRAASVPWFVDACPLQDFTRWRFPRAAAPSISSIGRLRRGRASVKRPTDLSPTLKDEARAACTEEPTHDMPSAAEVDRVVTPIRVLIVDDDLGVRNFLV